MNVSTGGSCSHRRHLCVRVDASLSSACFCCLVVFPKLNLMLPHQKPVFLGPLPNRSEWSSESVCGVVGQYLPPTNYNQKCKLTNVTLVTWCSLGLLGCCSVFGWAQALGGISVGPNTWLCRCVQFMNLTATSSSVVQSCSDLVTSKLSLIVYTKIF